MVQNVNTIYKERLKYEEDILSKINITLPPNDAEAKDLIQVYRTVVDADNIHMNDFIPKAFKNPYSPRIQYTEEECGISVFSKIENVKAMLVAYRGKQTQIAIGDLSYEWGKSSDFDSKNHANHWKHLYVDYELLVESFKKI